MSKNVDTSKAGGSGGAPNPMDARAVEHDTEHDQNRARMAKKTLW